METGLQIKERRKIMAKKKAAIATIEKVEETVSVPELGKFELLPPIDEGVQRVPFSSIIMLDQTRIKNAKLAMREINSSHVEHMVLAIIDDNTIMPPLMVQRSSAGNILVDGNHRYNAIRDVFKLNTPPENLHEVVGTLINVVFTNYETERELLEGAFLANRENGLPTTDASRSKYAIWLLNNAAADGLQLSVRSAARLAGVSHTAVNKMLKKSSERSKKSIDDLLPSIDEEEAAELEESFIQEEWSQSEDELLTAIKGLLKSLKKVTQLAGPSVTDENSSRALHDYILNVAATSGYDYAEMLVVLRAL
jgi:hypothetical protein